MKKYLVLSMLLLMTACTGKMPKPDGILSFGDGVNPVKATFHYVLFDTLQEKRNGLSFVENLDEDVVALFALSEQDGSFWMKDMRFPLDLLFYNEEKQLISILFNLEPCVDIENCPSYNIPRGAAWAIEIKAGVLSSYDFEMGDRFSL